MKLLKKTEDYKNKKIWSECFGSFEAPDFDGVTQEIKNAIH